MDKSLVKTVERELAGLEKMDSKQLVAELAAALNATAQQLVRLAAIIRVLEERGEDLSDIRIGLINWLRKIAYGQVLPEVVVKYQASPLLLSRVAALPLPDQQKLLEEEAVELITVTGSKYDKRRVPLLDLSRTEITQAFAADHLRNAAEQRGYLDTPARRNKRRARDEKGVEIDYDKGGIKIGDLFLSRGDIAKYLAQLEGGR